MSSEPPLDWLALALLPGLGPITSRRALERFGDPADVAYTVPPRALAEIAGISAQAAESVARARTGLRRRVEREAVEAERLGIAIVPRPDPRYPATIAALEDAPPVLFVKGSLAEGITRVAVVGSRRATAYGRRVAARLAEGLAARGVEIVSGGARGIDTCAHEGALAGTGTTLAVLGAGFRKPYPPENERLFDRIAAKGGVISEFPLDADPRPEHFPRRNRLISALSAAVVVVEATLRSGSLTTASHALDQGREVLAVPGLVTSEQSQGCHRLIQQGAKLVGEVDDVIEELSPMYRAALRPAPAPPMAAVPASDAGLTGDEAALARLMDDPEPVHIDALAESAPFGIARLHAALVGLVLRGRVEQLPGGYYSPAFPKTGPRED